jgi:hypothetical protein
MFITAALLKHTWHPRTILFKIIFMGGWPSNTFLLSVYSAEKVKLLPYSQRTIYRYQVGVRLMVFNATISAVVRYHVGLNRTAII